MPDFWPDEWIRSLKEIEQMDFDYVISAHGPEDQPAIDLHGKIFQRNSMDSGTHSPDVLRKTVKLA